MTLPSLPSITLSGQHNSRPRLVCSTKRPIDSFLSASPWQEARVPRLHPRVANIHIHKELVSLPQGAKSSTTLYSSSYRECPPPHAVLWRALVGALFWPRVQLRVAPRIRPRTLCEQRTHQPRRSVLTQLLQRFPRRKWTLVPWQPKCSGRMDSKSWGKGGEILQ